MGHVSRWRMSLLSILFLWAMPNSIWRESHTFEALVVGPSLCPSVRAWEGHPGATPRQVQPSTFTPPPALDGVPASRRHPENSRPPEGGRLRLLKPGTQWVHEDAGGRGRRCQATSKTMTTTGQAGDPWAGPDSPEASGVVWFRGPTPCLCRVIPQGQPGQAWRLAGWL